MGAVLREGLDPGESSSFSTSLTDLQIWQDTPRETRSPLGDFPGLPQAREGQVYRGAERAEDSREHTRLLAPCRCQAASELWQQVRQGIAARRVADEHGGAMDRIHAGSLAFMSKPVAHSIGRTNSPSMLQTLLYWGSFWGQGWEVGNDKAPFGQTALDYAPLFRQIRGKLWAGDAHAVAVVGGGAAANLFEIEAPKGSAQALAGAAARTRVLVVVFGPADGTVTVALRGVSKYSNATLFHPGASPRTIAAPTASSRLAHLSVQLSHGDPHGCAVVRLVPTGYEPKSVE